LNALADQLIGLVSQKPVLFILKDAHWIDSTTLELIELCLDRAASAHGYQQPNQSSLLNDQFSIRKLAFGSRMERDAHSSLLLLRSMKTNDKACVPLEVSPDLQQFSLY
jgi:predicted ATPase